MSMKPLIQVQAVSQRFSTAGGDFVALQNVSFDIHEGDTVSLLRHSGCGKSTLLYLIAGIALPTDDGLIGDIREISASAPELAGVFQNHSLLPCLTFFAPFALAAGLLMLIKLRPVPDFGEQSRLRRDLAEGFALIRHSRPLMVILVFMAVTGVGEAIMGTLIAPFVHDVLDDGGLIVQHQQECSAERDHGERFVSGVQTQSAHFLSSRTALTASAAVR